MRERISETEGQRTIQWGKKARVDCTRTEWYGNRQGMNQRVLATKKRYYSCYVLLGFSKVRLRWVTTVQGFRHFIRWVTAESFCGGPRGTIDQSAFPFCLNTTEAKNGIRGGEKTLRLEYQAVFGYNLRLEVYRPSLVSHPINHVLLFS